MPPGRSTISRARWPRPSTRGWRVPYAVTDVWSGLIGQAETVGVLRNAAVAAAAVAAGESVAAGSMSHAWLFTGPAGSGRSVAARALAAALECTTVGDPGCGHCSACHTVLTGTHPDVRLVVPEGLSISVADIRGVVATAARLPALGRWQVVVIEDADRMTEGASNALLKAIEEPPARTIFLLCAPSTHPDDVSVTIRSRCRLVSLRTPPADAVAAVLMADGVDPQTAAWAASAAQGHVGRARRLARDDDARSRRSDVLAIPASLRSLSACVAAADRLVRSAESEASSITAELDADETQALQTALGAGVDRPRHGDGGARIGRGGQGPREAAAVARDPHPARRPRPGAGRPGRVLPRRRARPGRVERAVRASRLRRRGAGGRPGRCRRPRRCSASTRFWAAGWRSSRTSSRSSRCRR